MSRKHFSWLLGVTVVAAIIVLLLPGRTGQESGFTRKPFLPELEAQVNDLDWLRVRQAGDTVVVTLERGEQYWRVQEFHGYRADWEQLRSLLAELAQAEIVEAKTANPDYYDRLGVEDVSAEDAGGLRLEFAEATGLPAVIVGNRPEGRSGRYLRLAKVAESVLVDRNLDVPGTAADWLDKTIVDIADSEVVEVEIVHPDGERIEARKTSADDEHFELLNVPEEREIRSAWTVDSLANALAALNLEAVAPQDELDWTDAVSFSLITADGLRVEVDGIVVEEEQGEAEAETDPAAAAPAEHWVRLQAGLYQTALDSAVEAPEADDAESDAEGEPAAVVDTTARAAEINRRVSGWAYRVPKYKFDAMNKRMEELLKAPAEDDS